MTDIIKVPDVLLPKGSVDYTKWATVACDQFTSNPSYWQSVGKAADNVYSSYHIIYPEIYLGNDESRRIERINYNMEKYAADGIFDTVGAFILTERTTKYSKIPRFGLIISVDLEAYDFKPFNSAYIKATEGTIVERLPVRVKIRENALLELPHIILLADDCERKVIEPLIDRRGELKKLYDFELNQDGGHIRGYKVEDTEEIKAKLYALLDPALQLKKYGVADSNFLFAVGDGNHSLAAAKACWEKLRAGLPESDRANHPARFALVELMNLYDEALKFEPIHRVVYSPGADFFAGLTAALNKNADNQTSYITVFDKTSEYRLKTAAGAAGVIKDVQDYIETYLRARGETSVDYIHGESHLREAVRVSENAAGIVMPALDKSELFSYVLKKGVLPKKAFSMGEAEEKRYYFECKKIR